MKGEDVAALRIGIEAVGELRFNTGAFVRKRQRFTELRVNIEQAFAVFAGLFFDARQRETFGLRFDCADGFAVNKQEVVRFITPFEQRFANSHTAVSGKIDRFATLNLPAARRQQFIDIFARELFWGRHEARRISEIAAMREAEKKRDCPHATAAQEAADTRFRRHCLRNCPDGVWIVGSENSIGAVERIAEDGRL